jgi:hypothetical protein
VTSRVLNIKYWQLFISFHFADHSVSTSSFAFILGRPGTIDSINISLSNGAYVTPLPAALPPFATGLGALGLLGWRRKHRLR